MQHPTCSRPISLFCLAAPDDTTFLAQWERHLLPLQQAGLVRFWSEQRLQAGADRMEQLVAHLNQADCMVLLISSDFFADDDCLTLMQHALLQKPNTVLIPLLLRPVEWQDSALGSLPCLPISRVPITQWPDPDDAFSGCVQGLRSLLQLPASVIVTPSRSRTHSNPNRERMLRRLRRSYRDLLAQSLQGIAWIELGLTERPNAVQNMTNFTLRIAQQEERPLPPSISILQVYEEAEEELLILGEPGAGKSTLLLHLAQHLVVLAEADERCLLPTLLPLSSWAVKQAALSDWMIEQIAVTYDIPRKVSQQWVEQEQILPLLDGLDEMQEGARPACIATINAYHREHLTPLVVCSRTSEYESAASSQRLALQSSVVVRPLTSEQTEVALSRARESVAELRTALHEQPALQELATTPLMLSVLMLAYQGTSVSTGSLKEKTLEQQIWTDYIQRMMERKRQGQVKQYQLSQTRSWLGWLAQQMRRHDQTIFYAERLQADWLPDRQKLAYAWLAERVPALLIGILASLFIWLFSEHSIRLTLLLQVGLVGAFLGGWLKEIQEQPPVSRTDPPRKKRSSRPLVAMLGSSLVLGALVGASFGFYLNGNFYRPLDWLRDGLIYGIGIGLGGWIILASLSRHSLSVSPSKTLPVRPRLLRTRWRNRIHLRRAATIALVLGAVSGLSEGLSHGLRHGLFVGLFVGLGSGLSIGLGIGCAGFLLSFVLEKREGRLRLAERLRWSGWFLLRPEHLRNSLLFAGLLFLLFGLIDGLVDGLSAGLLSGLSAGLSIGLSYWLLMGLHQGVIQEQIEDQDHRAFNQGIRRSLRNGFFASLLSGAMIMGIGVLSAGLSNGLSNGLFFELRNGLGRGLISSRLSEGLIGLSIGLSYGWFLALSGGLLIWASIGGLTIWRHYVLRLLLARSHTFPWRAQAFLDAATAHVLLRRVGGGYSFVHRRLLDYFADAYSASSKE